jgi:pyruvate dehydrogenase E1 component
LSDEEVVETPFYRPALESRETQYLLDRRRKLGGFLPNRQVKRVTLPVPDESARKPVGEKPFGLTGKGSVS